MSLKIMDLMNITLLRNLNFRGDYMEQLMKKLNELPDTYFGFVAGVVAYVRKKPERLDKVMRYIENTDSITPSDIVKFIMLQPDFHEDGLSLQEQVG